MSVEIKPLEVFSSDKLVNIVLGRDKSFPRLRALTLLQSSDVIEKINIYKKLLEDEREDSRIRYSVAINLYQINTKETEKILIEAAEKVKDPEVMLGIVKGLGRIGGEKALEIVLKIKEQADGVLAKQAEFAASVISYRLGLKDYDLPIPEDFFDLPSNEAHPVKVKHPDEREAKICIDSLINEPYGIEISEDHMYQLDCARNRWMMVFNKDFIHSNSIKTLQERKAILGLLATRSDERESYSYTHIIFTSPSVDNNKVNILIYHITGKPVFAGEALINANQARFKILSVRGTGIFPIEIHGTFNEDGKLIIEHMVSAMIIREQKHPTQLKRYS